MRIMLDTNVLISVIIFNSERLKEMIIKICDNHTLVLSSYVLHELEDVIDRKFPSKKKALDEFLYRLPYELEYTPSSIIDEEATKIRDK